MKVKSDWKTVLTRAWSVRLMIIAALLAGVEAFLPLAWETGWLDLPPGWFPIITLVVVMAALFARLIVQTGITND